MSSCLESEEEIWVNADSSGRARLHLTAPTLLFDELGGAETFAAKIRQVCQESDNLTLASLHSARKNGSQELQLEVSFRDVLALGDDLQGFREPDSSSRESAVEHYFGSPRLQAGFPHLQYRRAIDWQTLVPDAGPQAWWKPLLGNAQVHYQLHLPSVAKNHNAHQVSPDGRTLQWTFATRDLLSGEAEMTVQTPIPGLGRHFFLLGTLLLALVVALLALRKRLRPRAS
ncbi:hypothetical protein [Roseibacillus ishigakijimensis]|uniref:DUF3153 domain-containing protein n=1 Tax=Roseibacillus ishigakijimensis TaxID=454146 RepID=A0A934RNI6_9BACT|nr:hypothetical protein [Roseibacillus ishigakijimensis]MBK1834083.1 hypothetical protein [Roseibacillus ishigakijimensis]